MGDGRIDGGVELLLFAVAQLLVKHRIRVDSHSFLGLQAPLVHRGGCDRVAHEPVHELLVRDLPIAVPIEHGQELVNPVAINGKVPQIERMLDLLDAELARAIEVHELERLERVRVSRGYRVRGSSHDMRSVGLNRWQHWLSDRCWGWGRNRSLRNTRWEGGRGQEFCHRSPGFEEAVHGSRSVKL